MSCSVAFGVSSKAVTVMGCGMWQQQQQQQH